MMQQTAPPSDGKLGVGEEGGKDAPVDRRGNRPTPPPYCIDRQSLEHHRFGPVAIGRCEPFDFQPDRTSLGRLLRRRTGRPARNSCILLPRRASRRMDQMIAGRPADGEVGPRHSSFPSGSAKTKVLARMFSPDARGRCRPAEGCRARYGQIQPPSNTAMMREFWRSVGAGWLPAGALPGKGQPPAVRSDHHFLASASLTAVTRFDSFTVLARGGPPYILRGFRCPWRVRRRSQILDLHFALAFSSPPG